MDIILSIQSHVAYGYVGNKAAVFPLQRLGYDVIPIHTVQFSNHTGYGAWTGEIFTPGHIQDIIKGLRDLNILPRVRAVLSGYMGTAELGDVVLQTCAEIRSHNPHMVYCCDPVMGDVGRGFFVKPGIPEFFRDRALPHAAIITPNQFELSWLTGIEVKTLNDALIACHQALSMGPEIVVLTSLQHDQTPEDHIQMLLVTKRGERLLITTPRLPIGPNGAGDAVSALILGHFLRSGDVKYAFEKTASAIYSVFDETHKSGQRELALIRAQDRFDPAVPRFMSQRI